jgi:ATP-dependent DNA helicase RecG
MYDRLLSQGRPAPLLEEGTDWVKVTIFRRILRPEVMRLIAEADARYQLTQRERITLGALAQSEGMTAQELAVLLEVEGAVQLGSWLGRLEEFGLIQRAGRTKGTRYFVDPGVLRDIGLALTTSLKRIEPHRLLELVREDLRRYPDSKIGEISGRIGPEVPRAQLKRALAQLVLEGAATMAGVRAAARYRLADGPGTR